MPAAPVAATCMSGCPPGTSASRRWRGCGPSLASLLAITVNSPIAGGHDTAWASRRYPLWSRWPTATPPAVWPDVAAYDAAIRGLIDRGAALDEQGVYLFARLSSRYPTVEVRVADVCLDVGTAVLLAGLTRALVATALAEARRGTPVATAPWASAALVAAARHGLTGAGVDPFTGQTVDARSLRWRLLDHVHAALSDRDDRCGIHRSCGPRLLSTPWPWWPGSAADHVPGPPGQSTSRSPRPLPGRTCGTGHPPSTSARPPPTPQPVRAGLANRPQSRMVLRHRPRALPRPQAPIRYAAATNAYPGQMNERQ